MSDQIESKVKVDGCLAAALSDLQFNESMMEAMAQKSATIDLKRICLFMEVVKENNNVDDERKGQKV